jgi:hypothetical protein
LACLGVKNYAHLAFKQGGEAHRLGRFDSFAASCVRVSFKGQVPALGVAKPLPQHRIAIADGGAGDDPSNGERLCADCHAKLETGGR